MHRVFLNDILIFRTVIFGCILRKKLQYISITWNIKVSPYVFLGRK